MTTTKKPNGWIVENKHGLRLSTADSDAEVILFTIHLLAVRECNGQQGNWPLDDWQIKPACLISPERLEELEGYEAAWNKQVQDRCDKAVVEIDDSVKDL